MEATYTICIMSKVKKEETPIPVKQKRLSQQAKARKLRSELMCEEINDRFRSGETKLIVEDVVDNVN